MAPVEVISATSALSLEEKHGEKNEELKGETTLAEKVKAHTTPEEVNNEEVNAQNAVEEVKAPITNKEIKIETMVEEVDIPTPTEENETVNDKTAVEEVTEEGIAKTATDDKIGDVELPTINDSAKVVKSEVVPEIPTIEKDD